LDAERNPDAAGPLHEVQEISVISDIHARLSQTPFSEGNHGCKEFADIRTFCRQIVVPEPDHLALPPMAEPVILDVFHHLAGRAGAKARVDGGNGAERAGERASARGLDHTLDEEIAAKKVISRSRQSGERLSFADVSITEPTRRCILQELSPDRFRLAKHHAIDMLQGLIRIESDMRTACDDQ